ncbi:unnamed protein product [Owenia fusiformis]|uniref:Uncharacterized protein n=1 Tax=Owenia fusiformis TaxID=6347 RepID=A0A8S4PI61_OWEFU|nr:unnamed protein product [Owenia fusiformis]
MTLKIQSSIKKSQQWQQQTENTINRLTVSSEHVANQIEDSSHLQSQLLDAQNASLENQERLLSSGQSLSAALEQSQGNVAKMVENFKHQSTEQRALMGEVFERIQMLQSIVMGEFTGFYSWIFYTFAIIVSYLITSTPRTSGARIWLFAIMTLNIMTERMVVSWYVNEDAKHIYPDANVLAFNRLWWCRTFYGTLAVVILGMCTYRYRDLVKETHDKIAQIFDQNKMIMENLKAQPKTPNASLPLEVGNGYNRYIEGQGPAMITHGGHGVSNTSSSSGISADMVDSQKNLSIQYKRKPSYSPKILDETQSGYNSDDSNSNSDDSFAESDHTYIPRGKESDSDTSIASFATGLSRQSSRCSTPSLYDELRDLRKDMGLVTPAKDGSTSIGSAGKRGPGRPKGSRNNTPVHSPMSGERFGLQRYNLRNRNVTSPNVNPIVNQETEGQFGQLVKRLQKISHRNSMLARFTIERKEILPSDDDM